MTVPRVGHTATLLNDGRVLVIGGGYGSCYFEGCSKPGDHASAEFYDPRTGAFSPTGSMGRPRRHHTATLLADGRLLVVGGQTADPASAEIYDPQTGQFTPTGSLHTGRVFHTATLLPNGKVLIAGGRDTHDLSSGDYRTLASAELYDPETGAFTPAGSMTVAREDQTATLLKDGRVLIAGGSPEEVLRSAEIYDPQTGTVKRTGQMTAERWLQSATLLNDGRVLIVGGYFSGVSAELFDPKTGKFRASAPPTIEFWDGVSGTLLADGRVLILRWEDADVFDPATATFAAAGEPVVGRLDRTATLLPDGRVLIAGGGYEDGDSTAQSAELYVP
jgi:WD40 repeat protein